MISLTEGEKKVSRSKLKTSALNHYRVSRSAAWVLGLTTGILIAAILAIDLVVPGLVILTFPFIILPLIFSATMQHLMIHHGANITLTGSFRSFFLYFRQAFFGSFNYLFSLLKSVIIFISVELIVSFLASFLFQTFSKEFVEAINYMYAAVETNEVTIETLEQILAMHNGILSIYFAIVIVPAFFIAVLFLIYFISRFSVSIYMRFRAKAINSRFVRFVYGDVVRRKRGEMLFDYLSLNWPLFILLIFGFAGGSVLGFYWQHDFTTMLACGMILGALLSSFFLPFYFPNQEALYDKYEVEFRNSANNIARMLVRNIQNDIEISQEEKERLEKAIADANNPLDDEDEEDKNPDE